MTRAGGTSAATGADAPRFEVHARTVALLTFVSRITGLVRDATLSRVFGAGPLMDAFFFAFMIPNLFRRLFGEGALAAAFLPAYARLRRDDPALARPVASATVALLVVVLGALVVVGETILLALPRDGDTGLALDLLAIMLPYMPLVCLVAILGAVLQVHHRFGPTAAAPIVLNLGMIGAATAGILLGWREAGREAGHVALVAGAVVAAGIVQVLWSLWALRRESWWTLQWRGAGAPLRRVLLQAGPMIVGLGVLQLNTFIDGIIASYPTTVGATIGGVDYPLGAGAMATISFAQRLYQFPLGVFGVALATAIFPALSVQTEDDGAFGDTLRRGLRLVLFIGLPASAGLVLVRRPLVTVILQGGAFTLDDVARVSFVLLGYASAVWAYCAIHVVTRAFYARGDARTPVRVAVAVVALNLALNCSLIWTPLREAGLAWSTAICAVVQLGLLLRGLSGAIGRLIDRDLVRSALQVVGLTLVMVVTVGVLAIGAADPASWGGALASLVLAVVVGIVVIAGGARVLRMPELGWLLSRRAG
jgi:putative peptidoglycan lipid II flippase